MNATDIVLVCCIYHIMDITMLVAHNYYDYVICRKMTNHPQYTLHNYSNQHQDIVLAGLLGLGCASNIVRSAVPLNPCHHPDSWNYRNLDRAGLVLV